MHRFMAAANTCHDSARGAQVALAPMLFAIGGGAAGQPQLVSQRSRTLAPSWPAAARSPAQPWRGARARVTIVKFGIQRLSVGTCHYCQI